MKPLSKLLFCSILACLIASCSKEDTVEDYPSAITELVELNTNTARTVVSMRTDRGETFGVTESPLSGAKPDTTYRCLCIYEKVDNKKVHIYQTALVLSMHPLSAEKYNTLPKVPVHIISHWRTDRYLNFLMSYKTVGADKHSFGFCEEKTEVESDGKQTVYVSLLHQKPTADSEAYTQKFYASVPTFKYAATYDNIVFTVTTEDGPVEYKYSLR